MSSMVDIRPFVPERASREEWAAYHDFRRRRQREWRPDEPAAPDDVVELRRKRGDPRAYRYYFHVVAGDEIVAELAVEGTRPESPEYATNRHLFWAEIYVLRAHRRRGIALGLVPRVVERMDEHGGTVLGGGAEDESGHAFLRRLGADPRLTERASRLDFAGVDWDMVDSWVREGEARSPGARLDLYPRWVPDELLDQYCADMSELLNTMPFEGLDHGEIVVTPEAVRESRERMVQSGSTNPTCVVRDADGSVAGMTDVRKHPYEPGIVHQEFTGVHPRARGRGVGKWLKAAMLRHVRQAYPDTRWISTENAGSNAAMLSINHALGFKLHRTQTVYQVDLETLRRTV
jgi:mycothiol synthase